MSTYLQPLRAVLKGRAVWGVLLLGVIVLLGCSNKKNDAEAATAEADMQYKIGAPITDSTVAAVVVSAAGSDTLSTAEFRGRMDMFLQRYPMVQGNLEQMREIRRQIVEDFVMRHALDAEADRLKLVADTARVSAQLARIRGQYPDQNTYRQALAAEGLTEDSLRTMIGQEVRLQTLQEQMLTDAKNPTPAELEAFRKEQSQQIRSQHILFPVTPTASTEEDAKVRTQAQAVLDSARQGVDFAALARRHSADASAAQGGDLDFFSRGQMVPSFERAAFALADSGDVTQELVRTRFGYHIIRLTGRRTSELMDTSAAREAMLNVRRQKAVEAAVGRIRQTVTVHLNDAIVDTKLDVPQDL